MKKNTVLTLSLRIGSFLVFNTDFIAFVDSIRLQLEKTSIGQKSQVVVEFCSIHHVQHLNLIEFSFRGC